MSRTMREAKLKALRGGTVHPMVVSELGGRKRDRKKLLVDQLEHSYQRGSLGGAMSARSLGMRSMTPTSGGNRMTPVRGEAGRMAPIASRFAGHELGSGYEGATPTMSYGMDPAMGRMGRTSSGAYGSSPSTRQDIGGGRYTQMGSRTGRGTPAEEARVQMALRKSAQQRAAERAMAAAWASGGGGAPMTQGSMAQGPAPTPGYEPIQMSPLQYTPMASSGYYNPIQMGAPTSAGQVQMSTRPGPKFFGSFKKGTLPEYEGGSLADIIAGALSAPDVGARTPDLRKYGPAAASTFPLTAGSLLAAKIQGLPVEETPEGAYVIERDEPSDLNYGQALGEAIWKNPGLTPQQDEGVYRHELGHVSQARDLGLAFPLANTADQLRALLQGTDPQDAHFEVTADERGRELLRNRRALGLE